MSIYLQTAINSAKQAGKLILKSYSRKIEARIKDGISFDLVTDADINSEKTIISIIKKKFPNHSFLTEEKTVKQAEEMQSEYLWVIDPIDGTINFAHKFPFFAISIALYKNNSALLGVVYDPIKKEMFHAEKSKGAFLNNKKISVSKTNSLNKSLLATGFFHSIKFKTAEKFLSIPIHYLANFGSAALELSYIAAGRLDGYWELRLKPWDYAAGVLIVTEAGGKITDLKGNNFDLLTGNVLASNGKLHDEMLKIIDKKFYK
ncbi:inositol monophosphatase [Candidatus Pacearchaeota archaeon]|nr:inositol monophosphatase [Candidatus Pacearchaeota archaeon]